MLKRLLMALWVFGRLQIIEERLIAFQGQLVEFQGQMGDVRRDLHATTEKAHTAVTVLEQAVGCERCGAVIHRRRATRLRRPGTADAYQACQWCAPVLMRQGYKSLRLPRVKEA